MTSSDFKISRFTYFCVISIVLALGAFLLGHVVTHQKYRNEIIPFILDEYHQLNHRYTRFRGNMHTEVYDLSEYRSGRLLIWLNHDGEKDIIMGRNLDGKENLERYLVQDFARQQIKFILAYDGGHGSAWTTVMVPPVEVFKIGSWEPREGRKGHLMAKSYDGSMRIWGMIEEEK